MKLDPTLLPPRSPRCLQCQARMIMTDITSGPEGFEHRTFECRGCGRKQTRMVACDPMKSDAVGWLTGELGRSPGGE
jgi:hypothetical protein